MFDVAVIGAGPAGSTASRYLAKQGLKVCIIDKDTFPRDKPCGGGFARALLNDFPYLKNRANEFLKGTTRLGILHSPNRHIALSGKVEMAVALRTDFDNVLFESALEQGAVSYVGSRAKHVRFNSGFSRVDLANGNSIKACMIVGADGVTSMVARESGLHRSWPKSKITACRVAEVPARQGEIIDRYTEDLHYHFFASFGGLPGYGWIFPKQETINIGLGIVAAHARGLPGIFDGFVRYLKGQSLLMQDADLSSARGALVPTGGPVKRTVSKGCLIVGDAAGMVDPLTGGGIAYAMRAGRHAAHAIAAAFENGLEHAALTQYEQSWKNDFGNDFKDHLLAQKVITSPFTDLFFEIGRRDELIQKIVSESMDSSSENRIDTGNLALRVLLVCLRGALRI